MVSQARIGQLRSEVSDDQALITPDGSDARGDATQPLTDVPWPGDALRELVRFDDRGRYRPLSGAKTLPSGWQLRCAPCDVDTVIETVYPLATVHRRQWERGVLRVVGLDEILERQSGRYAISATLDDDGRELARRVLCGDCVRAPAWAGESPDADAIPCPEPCSVFISLCREAALWQQDAPPRSPVDASAPYAAFEHPGNAIREAYLAAREGERIESERGLNDDE